MKSKMKEFVVSYEKIDEMTIANKIKKVLYFLSASNSLTWNQNGSFEIKSKVKQVDHC